MSLYICCVLLAATTCGIVGIVNSNMVTKKDMGDILQGTSREYAQEIDITLAEIETAVNSQNSIMCHPTAEYGTPLEDISSNL